MKVHQFKISGVCKTTVVVLTLVLGMQVIVFDVAQANQQANTNKIDFNRAIRPILSDKCWACHGPDAANKKMRLRLDSEAAAKADLGGGLRAVVPNHPEQSELIRRITSTDKYEVMPPASTGKNLSVKEIELLTEWIKQGATFQSHWAFVTPTRPALPVVKNTAWVKNPIDNFVLARLEKEGLEPSPEADRATWLRRVSLDLTGLPPSLQELDGFLADKASDAFEKVVDRLLSSPRYGERMAFRWLDAARYADTNGYQIDGDRSAWRWRDWVIDAYNKNKPYNDFVIEQLAGDLLPNATLEQKIATAFNRNHRINAEGGIVSEEYRNEYVVDRIDTTSTVFMGLSIGCARCHNHKYDPFTQKEFYQIGAYFNSIDEDGHSFDQGNAPPYIHAPTADQQTKLQEFDTQISAAQQQFDSLREKSLSSQRSWEKTIHSVAKNLSWAAPEKLLVHIPLDESQAPIFNKDREYYEDYGKKKDDPETKFEIGFKDGKPQFISSPVGTGAVFDGKTFFDAGIHADFRYKSTSRDFKERFTLAAWVYPETEQSGSIITKISDNAAEVENGEPRAEGYGLYFLNGKIHFNMVFRWGEDTLRAETENVLPLKQWQHVVAVFDGLQQWENRLRIYVNGQEQKLKFNQRTLFLHWGGTKNTLKIGAGGGPQFRFKGAIDEVNIYSRALEPHEIAALACADEFEKIAAMPDNKRPQAQRDKIFSAYLQSAASDKLKQAAAKLFSLKQDKQKFVDDLQTLMVMQEMPQPRETYLLRRGSYDAPAEKVERGVPVALPSMPKEFPNNRLGFAKWLVSAEHPLTARVAVNRFWQMLFGAGLVKTSEDFGSQGELPSHPELLDWLAVTFRDGNAESKNAPQSAIRNPQSWDIKLLLRTIVLSATYRQSSKVTSTLLQKDADNRLLARGPRVRLSAEIIRDQALFAAGLLVEKTGGPSVKPYQPEGLYKDMAFGGLTGYDQAKGEGLWRRSLYTFWKRTILSPSMAVFDASAREFCTVRDTRTNTPLQSLNMMNDVTYIEAARLLGERLIVQGGVTPAQRLSYGVRLLTGRQANAQELSVLENYVKQQTDYFTRNTSEALKLLAVGERHNDAKINQAEVAAYAMAASMLLNLDEVITKQ